MSAWASPPASRASTLEETPTETATPDRTPDDTAGDSAATTDEGSEDGPPVEQGGGSLPDSGVVIAVALVLAIGAGVALYRRP